MDRDSFSIRLMRLDEASLLRAWVQSEGWNPGLHDAACFLAADPGGFFVGELDGEPVSCISCVAYDGFGFVGHYIVHPAHRGGGYGWQTWQAGLARLSGRNVALDGVLAQQENYAKSGFQFAHYHIRQRLTGTGRTAAGIVRVSAVPWDDVLEYDRTSFPAPRAAFLKGWLMLPDSTALAFVRQGRLAGYGVVRRCVEGFKVGPLFADDLNTADRLLGALVAEAAGGPVFLDVPDVSANAAAVELAARFGGVEVFRTARMYTRDVPAIRQERVFGVTTLELG